MKKHGDIDYVIRYSEKGWALFSIAHVYTWFSKEKLMEVENWMGEFDSFESARNVANKLMVQESLKK
jgi:hypothetical protein